MPHPLVDAAAALTDEVLFPDAIEVDQADRVPPAHFDALAEAGLYGVEVAADLSPSERWLIAEHVASGCMSTAFVWIQHHSAVRALVGSANDHLVERWLSDLVDGRRRAGIAIGGVRPPEPSLRARRAPGGWALSGHVPWVTGWGVCDVLLVGAVTDSSEEVWSFVPALPVQALGATRHRLLAANASATVKIEFDGLVVPDAEIVDIRPHEPPPPHDGGGRFNGSLALGVTRRSCALMGSSPIDNELESIRRRLDEADETQMAAARAAASELALRATARLTVHSGSRAVDLLGHAQRLAREAHFTAVFGTRPSIKAHLLAMLEQPPTNGNGGTTNVQR